MPLTEKQLQFLQDDSEPSSPDSKEKVILAALDSIEESLSDLEKHATSGTIGSLEGLTQLSNILGTALGALKGTALGALKGETQNDVIPFDLPEVPDNELEKAKNGTSSLSEKEKENIISEVLEPGLVEEESESMSLEKLETLALQMSVQPVSIPDVPTEEDYNVDELSYRAPRSLRNMDAPAMWTYQGALIAACEAANSQLSVGTYRPGCDQNGTPFLVKSGNSVSDSAYMLPGSPAVEVMTQIEKFWDSEGVYRKAGLVWKRGVLMYGPPGCGKTIIVSQVSKFVTDKGGLVLLSSDPHVTGLCLRMIRSIEPDRPIVVMHEEVEEMFRRHGEQSFLTLLDGEDQVDNVMHIATTNYLRDLAPRVRSRPGRFDLVIEVGLPSEETRRKYISSFMKPFELTYDLAHVVKETEGMSLAAMKEVMLSTYLLELGTLTERVEYIRSLENLGT